jgi:hypothetical protein
MTAKPGRYLCNDCFERVSSTEHTRAVCVRFQQETIIKDNAAIIFLRELKEWSDLEMERIYREQAERDQQDKLSEQIARQAIRLALQNAKSNNNNH